MISDTAASVFRAGCPTRSARWAGLEGADTSGSETGGFTIVQGAGIPHLTVVGFNRLVDWPTLVERLAAASKGDVKPVVE